MYIQKALGLNVNRGIDYPGGKFVGLSQHLQKNDGI
jgi:hypothetical protein